ncbi:pyrimidine reductase family protein [Actinoallomurus bryophytorum]|uniref:pyrimidine reductase family protein n=1 Tax=Actinoallomurus bryophytorum TaxID=1490222 RepID=UPI001FE9F212|nr:pyrimidine reductase family protein [Actinoallomurus bryophytorum]
MDVTELTNVYAYPPTDRWLRANMVTSLDGAASYEGKVSHLGSEADQQVLSLLRGLSDVVIVGANTVRVEGYGPMPPRDSWRDIRRGRPPAPPLAIVSARLDLDFDAPVFADAYVRPILITCASAPEERRKRAEQRAEVLVCGDLIADIGEALDALAERGLTRQLSEGGPRLLAEIAAAGRLDELCLTLSPRIVAGTGPRIVNGPLIEDLPMSLGNVFEEDGFLFMRYLRTEADKA